MAIFRNETGRLRKLQAVPLGTERELQRLIEANLPEALGLQFLESEYATTTGGRIDTLAVDEGGSPVIIEYKRNRNDAVINQALSYLLWLRRQKQGFFEKLIMDRLGAEAASRIKLDWANPRVICIAESYSRFDIDTVEVVPLRIELLRYRFYSDDVFSLEPVTLLEEGAERAAERPVSPKASTASALDAARPPSGSHATQALFEDLRDWIMALDEAVIEKPTKFYVAYRITKNFAEVHVGRGHLKIYLRPINFVDPHEMISVLPDSYNWTMNRRIEVKSLDELERAKPLIEQSFRDVL